MPVNAGPEYLSVMRGGPRGTQQSDINAPSQGAESLLVGHPISRGTL
ncbi:hypothetical protein FOQG_12403 [Fusarium oxysporum f. sp. raphani 54005]|uniref:Uncharacterized protein n=2 Tax=Fusarium oxysporum TaxID=5507 RepID=X0BNF8_FUSOX|nr:hypothetical protein FOVG_05502 [Fusarium oxysporum f. sp. pisi HDV247]EXK83386.1 hypothetical protein FOQG_12403 [Fusarium oxysporum f. sp. raphani 54005]